MVRPSRKLIAVLFLAVCSSLWLFYIAALAPQARLNRALHEAVWRGDLLAAESSLRQGADPHSVWRNYSGFWQELRDSRSVHTKPHLWLEFLRSNHERYLQGIPPFYYARKPAMVKLLVAHGVNPNSVIGPYRRPLLVEFASRIGPDSHSQHWIAVIRALLECGADPDKKDMLGSNALHYMAGALSANVPGVVGPYGEAIRVLVAHGAKVLVTDERGETALDALARSPHAKAKKIRRMLTETGAKGKPSSLATR